MERVIGQLPLDRLLALAVKAKDQSRESAFEGLALHAEEIIAKTALGRYGKRLASDTCYGNNILVGTTYDTVLQGEAYGVTIVDQPHTSRAINREAVQAALDSLQVSLRAPLTR